MIELLNNGTMAAFAGAFFAFLLVAATDRRRSKKKRAVLDLQLKVTQKIIAEKRRTVLNWKLMLQERKAVNDSPVMRFCVDDIRRIMTEIADSMRVEEKAAIDVVTYELTAIDDAFDDVRTSMKMVVAAEADEEVTKRVIWVAKRLPVDYRDLYILLGASEGRIDHFLKKRYTECIDMLVDREALAVSYDRHGV